MVQRQVSLEDVRKTLSHPTEKLPVAADNTQEFRRKVDDRVHFVIVEHQAGHKVNIITTGWSVWKEES
jgi:hypothetical protein